LDQKPALVIIDASVVIKWFVREEGTDRARALTTRAASREIELHTTDFCFAECANAIWRLVLKQKSLTRERGLAVFSRLAKMPLPSAPSQDLVEFAYALAVETGITVYDGLYVALASALGGTVLTADRRMFRCLRNTEYAELVEVL